MLCGAVPSLAKLLGGRAIQGLGFSAGTVSPWTACLDGVASCDGIVLILGTRYGDPTFAGLRVAGVVRVGVNKGRLHLPKGRTGGLR